MCPLRFILVFFSAVLAGYLAWRTARSSSAIDNLVSEDSMRETASSKHKQDFNLKRMAQDGLWVSVDMASGKYLWRNLREMKIAEKIKGL